MRPTFLSLDFTGTHVLVTGLINTVMDTHHLALEGGVSRRDVRRTVKGLRNEGISAVGWPDVDSAAAILDESSQVGSVLVGSDRGALHEVRLDGRSGEQAERLLELKSGGTITGIKIKSLGQTTERKQIVLILACIMQV
eukprot:TRINITY_DN109741_c0_g1_i1.p1 TRINITY_DN109741_c0_g1~~TRINITY_DN109741_c0_g1_i1.p1  ORF type:complete len:152 (-),score=29.86 TRINITY_DN109741_c0_g1_i1:10-426(-)